MNARYLCSFRADGVYGRHNYQRSRTHLALAGYLLDSGTHYRLWFDLGFGVKNAVQRNGVNCDCLLREAEEQFAHGTKPYRQRSPRILEDRSGSHGCLAPTPSTLPQTPHRPCLP
jgi:hypothetical protein